CERAIKRQINRRFGELHGRALQEKIRNTPNAGPLRKIALFTGNWQKDHSVYRICSQLIASLRPHYHVTLVRASNSKPPDAASLDSIMTLPQRGLITDIAPLFVNDFHAVLFADAGMSNESIHLANLRLAPVQAALPGHPVSTFGSQIDYFISGADV